MKRTVVVLLVLGLLAGMTAAPAEAKKKKKKKPKRIERVVEIPYENPGIGVAPLGGYPVTFPSSGDIGLAAEELFFKIEVEDASGQNVWGFISQGDIDGNGVNDDGYGNFCGKHEEFQSIAQPGAPIIGIYAFSGLCDNGSPSVMTRGVVKITLSNLP